MRHRQLYVFLTLHMFAVILFTGCTMWRVFMRSEDTRGPQDPIPASRLGKIPGLSQGKTDWPNWRGPALNGKSEITDINKDWSKGLPLLWQVNFLCQGSHASTWSTPVIKGNRLVVPGRRAGEDLVFCLDADTGELIWQQAYSAEKINGYGPGARATPFIDNDRVYTFGKAGHLACWSLIEGKKHWLVNVHDFGAELPYFGHSSSPLVLNDIVAVQAGGTATVIAFDKMTGKMKWKALQGVAGYSAVTAIPIKGEHQVIAFHGEGLTGLKPSDGSVHWQIPWRTRGTVNAVTPTYEKNILFITSGYKTGCAALKPSTLMAETLWKNKNSDMGKTIASMHSDPILHEGYVYGYSGNSTTNNRAGYLNCLELKTGETVWSSREAGQGTMIYIDEHLLCLDLKGNLYLIKASPEKFEKVTEFPRALGNTSKPVWTAPVAANGKLYLRHRQHLRCYDISID